MSTERQVRCTKCREEKPQDKFYRDRTQAKGWRPSCIKCGRKARGTLSPYVPNVTDDVWKSDGEWVTWDDSEFVERYLQALKAGVKVSPAVFNHAGKIMKRHRGRNT